MAALITNMPSFTPFSFEQYIAPLNEYKKEYDRTELQFSEIESAASVLEKLAADAPNSAAYRTYRNYMDLLQGEADALAYNGLTPGRRQVLHNMRKKYTSDLIPIIAGVDKWEKAKERYDNLKEGERLNLNPYNMTVDNFIGANPDFRLVDLNTAYSRGTTQAKAASDRHYEGTNYSLAADGLHYAVELILGFLDDRESTRKEINTLFSDIALYAQSLDGNDAGSASYGVTGLLQYLEGLGLTDMDSRVQKEVLNNAVSGYIEGLTGELKTNFLSSGKAGSGSGTDPSVTIPSLKSKTIPIKTVNGELNDKLDASSSTCKQAIERGAVVQGVVRDEDGNYSLNPGSLTLHNTGDGVAFLPDGTEVPMTTEFILRNYPLYTSEDFRVMDHATADLAAYDAHIDDVNSHLGPNDIAIPDSQKGQNFKRSGETACDNAAKDIMQVIKLTDPTIYNLIVSGTLPEDADLNQIIQTAFDKYNSRLGDYGSTEYMLEYLDKSSQQFLMTSIRNYMTSNNNKANLAEYTEDGLHYKGTEGTQKDVEDIMHSSEAHITRLSWLPNDSQNLKVQIEYPNGTGKVESVELVIPATAISNEAAGALQGMTEGYEPLKQFETEHGKFQSPGTKPINQWTDAEKTFVKVLTLFKEFELSSLDNFDAFLQIKLGEDSDEYKLYKQYIKAKNISDGTYALFVQHLGYATGTTKIKPTEEDSARKIFITE